MIRRIWGSRNAHQSLPVTFSSFGTIYCSPLLQNQGSSCLERLMSMTHSLFLRRKGQDNRCRFGYRHPLKRAQGGLSNVIACKLVLTITVGAPRGTLVEPKVESVGTNWVPVWSCAGVVSLDSAPIFLWAPPVGALNRRDIVGSVDLSNRDDQGSHRICLGVLRNRRCASLDFKTRG